MNLALWMLQILVALMVVLAGAAKLVFPRERLARRMHWAATWPRGRIKLLGLAEVAGGVGLVLPMATGIASVLTPIAAVGLALLMAGAVRTHQRLHESALPPALILVLCLAIATGRFVSFSQRPRHARELPAASAANAARTESLALFRGADQGQR